MAPRKEAAPSTAEGASQNPETDSQTVASGPTIGIAAKRDGFCRCGRTWSAAGEEVSPDDFTPAQWAALLAEPMLNVVASKATLDELAHFVGATD